MTSHLPFSLLCLVCISHCLVLSGDISSLGNEFTSWKIGSREKGARKIEIHLYSVRPGIWGSPQLASSLPFLVFSCPIPPTLFQAHWAARCSSRAVGLSARSAPSPHFLPFVSSLPGLLRCCPPWAFLDPTSSHKSLACFSESEALSPHPASGAPVSASRWSPALLLHQGRSDSSRRFEGYLPPAPKPRACYPVEPWYRLGKCGYKNIWN